MRLRLLRAIGGAFRMTFWLIVTPFQMAWQWIAGLVRRGVTTTRNGVVNAIGVAHATIVATYRWLTQRAVLVGIVAYAGLLLVVAFFTIIPAIGSLVWGVARGNDLVLFLGMIWTVAGIGIFALLALPIALAVIGIRWAATLFVSIGNWTLGIIATVATWILNAIVQILEVFLDGLGVVFRRGPRRTVADVTPIATRQIGGGVA